MNSTTIRGFSKKRLAVGLLALASLLGAPAAFGHTHPEAMMPAANATVSAPSQIMIHFSGALEPKFSTITVSDAAGKLVTKEKVSVGEDAKVMTLPLPALAPGVYKVTWVAVSVDSHREKGSYTFTVK